MTACPTPDKKRYATPEAAQTGARRSLIGVGHHLYPYTCICTWWHLSKNPTHAIPADAAPDPADIARLQLQSDTTFRATVANEARGRAPLPDRLALRHTGILPRWNKHLKELRDDVNQQLNERAADASLEAHDWRRRAEGYRDSLTLRINECRDLRAHHTAIAAEQKAQREAATQEPDHDPTTRDARQEARDHHLDHTLDSHGIPRIERKELRRQAGEAAIKRLIDAHGTEFSRYLAEECDRLGVDVPNRVRKYLPEQTSPAPLTRTA